MEQAKQTKKIYWASGIVSICGIIYEILFGAAGSYILGDSVKQYAITIGLFLTGMGIGAAFSEKIMGKFLSLFVWIEYAIALIGGFSILTLFGIMAYTNRGTEAIFLYGMTLLVGSLTGLELPLLIRKATEIGAKLNRSTAMVLFSDYAGSLIGSVLFALVLRHQLGLVKTAFAVAFVNVIVALWISRTFQREIPHARGLTALGMVLLILISGGVVYGDQVAFTFEQKLYRYPMLDVIETPYQRVVVTKDQEDVRMYIDGNLQFSSTDEYRYHESIVHPAVSLAQERKHVLILGGGDGMVARELLKYPDIQSITLVDLDQQLVDYVQKSPLLSELNQNSLEHDKVKIVHKDAFHFLQDHQQVMYDVIISDLPDPNKEGLNKLYTREFYRLIHNRLMPGGVFVAQATSPVFAREVYWTISHTVSATGLQVMNYHVDIPSFGNWGFVMALHPEDPRLEQREQGWQDELIQSLEVEVPTRYLTENIIPPLFQFGKDENRHILDEQGNPISLQVNTVNHPVIIRLYEKAWRYY